MPVTKSKQGKPLGGIGAERQSPRRHALILDDRLLSKQYITNKLDARVDNTAYSTDWSTITDKAPSVAAVYNKINSMGLTTHEWTHESSTTSTKVRANHTGFYGIGPTDFDDVTHKLTIDGDVRSTGDVYLDDGAKFYKYASGGSTEMFRLDSANGHIITGPEAAGPFVIATSSSPSSSVTLADNTGRLQIGPSSSSNLGINEVSIQGRNGSGSDSPLLINSLGGSVVIGKTGQDSTTIRHDLNVTGDAAITGNTTITGNLTVNGSATSISTTQTTMEDPILILNADSTGADVDAGIEVERGSVLTNRRLFWDEGTDEWKIQTGDSTYTPIAGGGGTLTGTNTGDVTIVLASGVPSGSVTISNQAVTLGDKFVYNEGTANTIGVDGGADGKLSCFGTEGGSGTGTTGLVVKGGNSASGAPAVAITGALEADTKSFNIPHPLDSNKRLVYGCLEGPEYGMYQRGSFLVDDERRIVAIDLPNYWFKMVYEDYAINLTTYGDYNVWISNRDENGFWVETNAEGEWNFDWSVIGGRKDAKLEVEPDA